ncbi:hypothetical protein [Cryobacterium sp. TMT3-29-2]|nr:hypothetical protein [Cryobacterium sp. TMT3-29-2]
MCIPVLLPRIRVLLPRIRALLPRIRAPFGKPSKGDRPIVSRND